LSALQRLDLKILDLDLLTQALFRASPVVFADSGLDSNNLNSVLLRSNSKARAIAQQAPPCLRQNVGAQRDQVQEAVRSKASKFQKARPKKPSAWYHTGSRRGVRRATVSLLSGHSV
jgi:hypothetical protein